MQWVLFEILYLTGGNLDADYLSELFNLTHLIKKEIGN